MSVLFVGNGINQLAGVAMGWNALFAEAIRIDGFQVQDSLTPTLEYELNVRNAMKLDSTKTSETIKKEIAAHLNRRQEEAPAGWEQTIHLTLMASAPHTILTTNYDYFLERACDPAFRIGPASTREWLYSKERYRDVPGHRIYHIHGECAVPSSICLGFEHYVGSIQYIRSELTRGTSEKASADGIKRLYHLHDVLSGLDAPIKDRWYYSFFLEDVYILGFGLDAAEQDIWWLLNYRAEMMRKYPDLIHNTITYFETDSPRDRMPDKQSYDRVITACTHGTKAEQEEAVQKLADALSAARAKERFLSQKRVQLEAFSVHVVDCTAGGKNETYASRYTHALAHMKNFHTSAPELL